MLKRISVIFALIAISFCTGAMPSKQLFSSIKSDPIEEFGLWREAAQSEVSSGYIDNAILATVDHHLMPWQRAVHISAIDNQGFVFNSHASTNKMRHIAQNKQVSLLFLWETKNKQFIQVRITGAVESKRSAKSRVKDKSLNDGFNAYMIVPSSVQFALTDKSSDVVQIRYIEYTLNQSKKWTYSLESYRYPKVSKG